MSEFRSLGELLSDVLTKCEREVVERKRLRDIRDEGQTMTAIERLAEFEQIEANKQTAFDRLREQGILSTPGKPSLWDQLSDKDCVWW